MNQFAYRREPIILALHVPDASVGRRIVHKLSQLFDVHPDAIRKSISESIWTFFIHGAYKPAAAHWYFEDKTTFSAIAHTIFHQKILNDQTGIELKRFVSELNGSEEELEDLPIPLVYLHHNRINDTVLAAVDSIGVGRMYQTETDYGMAIGNSITALGLVGKDRATQNYEYWKAHYGTGGGIGESTFIRGVDTIPGGSRIVLTKDRLAIRDTHSIKKILLTARNKPIDWDAPGKVATRLIDSVGDVNGRNITIGLSGGRDSRFVAAVALNSDLNLTAQTVIPPALEGEIAKQLVETSRIPLEHRLIDKSDELSVSSMSEMPKLLPILDRAAEWFEFTGGDTWSTFTRSNPISRGRLLNPGFNLSGAYGDFTRGHYYTKKEAETGDSASALSRYFNVIMNYRQFLPEDVRRSAWQQARNEILEIFIDGFAGFQALEFAFLTIRQRKQLPTPGTKVIAPMLTNQMLKNVFWQDPVEKEAANVIRRLTVAARPEWENVPYFHELAKGQPPEIVNKVTIQPTYWEINENDFYDSVEQSVKAGDLFDLPMQKVKEVVETLPDGRNRTNSTFEFMFWHHAAVEAVNKVNQIRSESYDN